MIPQQDFEIRNLNLDRNKNQRNTITNPLQSHLQNHFSILNNLDVKSNTIIESKSASLNESDLPSTQKSRILVIGCSKLAYEYIPEDNIWGKREIEFHN